MKQSPIKDRSNFQFAPWNCTAKNKGKICFKLIKDLGVLGRPNFFLRFVVFLVQFHEIDRLDIFKAKGGSGGCIIRFRNLLNNRIPRLMVTLSCEQGEENTDERPSTQWGPVKVNVEDLGIVNVG